MDVINIGGKININADYTEAAIISEVMHKYLLQNAGEYDAKIVMELKYELDNPKVKEKF